MGGCPILCQKGDGFIPQVEVAGLHLGPSQALPRVSSFGWPSFVSLKNKTGDVPGGPVVKTHTSTAGGAGLIPCLETKSLRAAAANKEIQPKTLKYGTFLNSASSIKLLKLKKLWELLNL